MRPNLLHAAALVACAACSGDPTTDFTVADGGDGDGSLGGASGSAGAIGSAGAFSAGGTPGSGGASATGGVRAATGGDASAGGATASGGAATGAGGAPKTCELDTTPCTSCLGPQCPDAIQGCGTSASCLDALAALSACVCRAGAKTSDQCVIELAARGPLEAAFGKCLQTASACKTLCGL